MTSSEIIRISKNRYMPDGECATGGSGNIVFCLDGNLDRRVAIKSLRDFGDRSRIFDEISALMLLRSKHVAQIYDVVIGDDNNIGVVVEHINGHHLEEIIKLNNDVNARLKLLWQIASGISDIHSANLIHRDIKPGNMKIDSEGILKIFDFGLSREVGEKSNTTGFKGTRGYAAPELFNYGFVSFTQAVDVYAFGVIALEIGGIEIPSSMLNFPPAECSKGIFEASKLGGLPHVTALLERCLSYNAYNRPKMSDIRDVLASYILKGRHQGLAVLNSQHHFIHAGKRKAFVKKENEPKFSINYDDFRFFIDDLKDDVFVNAQRCVGGDTLPGSSVIAIGDESLGNKRLYVTFDISNPEVAL